MWRRISFRAENTPAPDTAADPDRRRRHPEKHPLETRSAVFLNIYGVRKMALLFMSYCRLGEITTRLLINWTRIFLYLSAQQKTNKIIKLNFYKKIK